MTSQIIIHSSNEPKPHFVLVPMMAQGHMIPMLDFAVFLAHHGSLVTVITTPLNASRNRATINSARDSGISIRFVELAFPCKELGLPEGCENIDIVPSAELMKNFFEGLSLLAEPVEKYLREQEPYPNCMVTDFCHHWTQKVADNLQIPRLTFFSICCFTLLCTHNISHYKVYDRITDEHEPFDVPGLSQKIVVTKDQAPAGFFVEPGWEEFAKKVEKAELAADGIVVNTFNDLELQHIKNYQIAMGKKVWAVGPFFLHNKNLSNMSMRGNKASIDINKCLTWLDSKEPRSVVYVNFGSLTFVEARRLIEIGLGLESSNHPFIWVIKEHEISPEVEGWLSEGFEERVKSRSLLIKGWAPQVLILSHPAVGGFMTHCGWNSTLEGISTGVPMITWPHFADQFLNERMVVDVLKIGVSVGVKKRGMWVDSKEVLANREDVRKAVKRLMDGGEAAEGIRQRATEVGRKARDAMKEGGSSYDSMTSFIHYFSVEGRTDDEGQV
ncbi:uncharacterized protein A4U43_C01F23920 [Asparagus officinalis]|uniref:Glycosyltransferase n=1 Tax=Asparagus officinalis TaxID=4686 RepID=A0A5P1FV87_ASPOF|nr:UDP-glycosyltransferase 73C6-like [Asparagus officinalis]ONK80979.1 uncharacterized protein A4U43_C01F23920 [Asparagus officinalis]